MSAPSISAPREKPVENQITLELSSLPIRISISPYEEKSLEIVKKVRGPLPLKVAVALYALDLTSIKNIEIYLKQKGINKDRYDLYSLCWRYGIPKVRHKTTFGEVITKYLSYEYYNFLIDDGCYDKVKEIYESNLHLGKRRALKLALRSVGLRFTRWG